MRGQAKCASRNMQQRRESEVLREPIAPALKRPVSEDVLTEVVSTPTLLLNVREARPLQALELLRRNLPKDEAGLSEWRHHARIAAVMASCPRSKESFKSGLYIRILIWSGSHAGLSL